MSIPLTVILAKFNKEHDPFKLNGKWVIIDRFEHSILKFKLYTLNAGYQPFWAYPKELIDLNFNPTVDEMNEAVELAKTAWVDYYNANKDEFPLNKAYGATQFEPKMQNRFIVQFPEEFGIPSYIVSSVNKPKFANGKWENIKIEFIDVINSITSRGLYKIVNRVTFRPPDSQIKELFTIKISTLDAIGTSIEDWEVSIGKILKIDFGELNYDSDEVQRQSLLLEPLNCSLNHPIENNPK